MTVGASVANAKLKPSNICKLRSDRPKLSKSDHKILVTGTTIDTLNFDDPPGLRTPNLGSSKRS